MKHSWRKLFKVALFHLNLSFFLPWKPEMPKEAVASTVQPSQVERQHILTLAKLFLALSASCQPNKIPQDILFFSTPAAKNLWLLSYKVTNFMFHGFQDQGKLLSEQ